MIIDLLMYSAFSTLSNDMGRNRTTDCRDSGTPAFILPRNWECFICQIPTKQCLLSCFIIEVLNKLTSLSLLYSFFVIPSVPQLSQWASEYWAWKVLHHYTCILGKRLVYRCSINNHNIRSAHSLIYTSQAILDTFKTVSFNNKQQQF